MKQSFTFTFFIFIIIIFNGIGQILIMIKHLYYTLLEFNTNFSSSSLSVKFGINDASVVSSLRTMQVFFWMVCVNAEQKQKRGAISQTVTHGPHMARRKTESAREFPSAVEEQRLEGISRHMIVLKIAILGKQWQNVREKQRCVHE